jgi:hypothetical protein
MTTPQKPIEQLLSESWNNVQVPSRDEFTQMMQCVTELDTNRINQYEGSNQPSPYYMSFKKYGIAIAGVGIIAALVLIIMPNRSVTPVSEQVQVAITSPTTEAQLEQEATKYAVAIPSADSSSAIDLAVRDIMLDSVAEVIAAESDDYQNTYSDDADILDQINS